MCSFPFFLELKEIYEMNFIQVSDSAVHILFTMRKIEEQTIFGTSISDSVEYMRHVIEEIVVVGVGVGVEW